MPSLSSFGIPDNEFRISASCCNDTIRRDANATNGTLVAHQSANNLGRQFTNDLQDSQIQCSCLKINKHQDLNVYLHTCPGSMLTTRTEPSLEQLYMDLESFVIAKHVKPVL